MTTLRGCFILWLLTIFDALRSDSLDDDGHFPILSLHLLLVFDKLFFDLHIVFHVEPKIVHLTHNSKGRTLAACVLRIARLKTPNSLTSQFIGIVVDTAVLRWDKTAVALGDAVLCSGREVLPNAVSVR